MRYLRLSEKQKEILRKEFSTAFDKAVEEFSLNASKDKFSVSMKFTQPARQKIVIAYTPEAFVKMHSLVHYYSTEIGWYGLVEKTGEYTYRVYDVRICKQTVDGSRVTTDDDDTLDFYNSLPDEEVNAMRFQAHSHVQYKTIPSEIDIQNQIKMVKSLGGKGFYIFQIWNKKNEINSFVFDLDAGVIYDKDDIVCTVEYGDSNIDSWLMESKACVVERKALPPYQYFPEKGIQYSDRYQEQFFRGNQRENNKVPSMTWNERYCE